MSQSAGQGSHRDGRAAGSAAPRVSIVVPNLDSPWVGRTAEALLAAAEEALSVRTSAGSAPPSSLPWSETVPVEILIVGQDTPGLLATLPPRAPGATLRRVETAERLNPAAARNRGVQEAQGDILLFTDADCAPRSDWILHLLAALEAAPIAGGSVTFDLHAGYWAVTDNIASFHELLPDRPGSSATDGPLGSLNLALTRQAWNAVGPFDEALTTSEDFDWILRARQAGLSTAFVPTAVVEHAPVRENRTALERHAAWYGAHFHEFRRRHPGVFDSGPTWRSRRRLYLAAPLKAWISALGIFQRHHWLPWRFLPGVAAFKRAWYREVLSHWK